MALCANVSFDPGCICCLIWRTKNRLNNLVSHCMCLRKLVNVMTYSCNCVQNVIWWNPEALLKSDFCMFRFAQIGSLFDCVIICIYLLDIKWNECFGLDSLSKAFYKTWSIWNTFFESLSMHTTYPEESTKWNIN